jgi:hypothetical protein
MEDARATFSIKFLMCAFLHTWKTVSHLTLTQRARGGENN